MSGVDIEVFGQACIGVRAGEHEVICDPWVLRAAQLGSWRAYPPKTPAEAEATVARLDRATHVYVSHDHADHFDPELLARLSPKVIVVARFHNARFRGALRALAGGSGHRVRELEPGEALEISDALSLRVIPEQPRFRTNSMLLVTTPVGAILNANDCGLNSATLAAIARRQRVRVFFYTLNFMANGYPFPYLRRGDPALLAKTGEVRAQVLESFRLAMETLRPELSVAFAGPVTFADAVNDHLHAHPESLDWSRMVDELGAYGRVAWPTPDSVLRVRDDAIEVEQPTTWPALRRARPPAAPLPPDAPEAFDAARMERAMSRFVERVGGALARSGQRVDTALCLSVVDRVGAIEAGPVVRVARIELDAPARHAWVGAAEAPCLHVTAPPSVLLPFLEGEATLDEVLLSARARFDRDPDRFHAVLHNFLRFGHDAEATEALLAWTAERAGSRATITRDVGGRAVTLPKFCPHEGESLELAAIDDGRVVCPRHKWCFEVASGACVAVGDPSFNLYQNVRERTP